MARVSNESPTPESTLVTRAELEAHLESGNPLDLSTRDEAGRTIAGSLLREVLIGKDLLRDPRGLTVVSALIPDHLDLSFCNVPVPLRLPGAKFRDMLTLRGATIAGQLDLRGAELNGKDSAGDALFADGLQVSGNAFLGRLTVTLGAVRLAGATINGQLSLTGAKLNGKDDDGDALVADGLQVGLGAFLEGLTVTLGAVRLAGATINGQLNLTGAKLNGKNDTGDALVADRLHIESDAVLERLTVTEGAVRLMGATINGQLNLAKAELNGRNDEGVALAADGLQVGLGAFLDGLTVTVGTVRLVGATINGQLNLAKAELNGKDNDGNALIADRLRVGGNANLGRSRVAKGAVRLAGASITGQLDLTDTELKGTDKFGNALVADGLQVTGDALVDQLKVVAGAKLDLRDGRLGNLVLEGDVPRSGWHRHNFLGLRYEQIHGGPARSARQGARLLRNADRPRAAQPYWQLADYYARVGNDSASRRLRVRSNVLQSRARLRSWPRFLYGMTTGFGYYPFLTLLWLAVFIGIDTVAVSAHSSDFIPTKAPTISAPLAKDQKPISSSVCDSRYPCFEPGLYATDTVIPVISLGQQEAWRLDDSRAGIGIQATLLFTSALGWILTTLLIGGVGGLLRRN